MLKPGNVITTFVISTVLLKRLDAEAKRRGLSRSGLLRQYAESLPPVEETKKWGR